MKERGGKKIAYIGDFCNGFFTGRELDEETGLYYYRARMYDAKIGRFLQIDPIGYFDSMNLYQYCNNNPVNWVDPMGLISWKSYVGTVAVGLGLGFQVYPVAVIGGGLILWDVADQAGLIDNVKSWWQENIIDPREQQTENINDWLDAHENDTGEGNGKCP